MLLLCYIYNDNLVYTSHCSDQLVMSSKGENVDITFSAHDVFLE